MRCSILSAWVSGADANEGGGRPELPRRLIEDAELAQTSSLVGRPQLGMEPLDLMDFGQLCGKLPSQNRADEVADRRFHVLRVDEDLLALAVRVLSELERRAGLLDAFRDRREKAGHAVLARLPGFGEFDAQAEQLLTNGEDRVDDCADRRLSKNAVDEPRGHAV